MSRLARRNRIYPVPVKPRTTINRWSDWPEDCVDRIREMVRGWYSTGGVFKCCDCGEFCAPHPYGVPHLGGTRGEYFRPSLNAVVLCDECLIARARGTTSGTNLSESKDGEHA